MPAKGSRAQISSYSWRNFDSPVVDHGTHGGHGYCSVSPRTTRPATTPNLVLLPVQSHGQPMWRVGLAFILPDRVRARTRCYWAASSKPPSRQEERTEGISRE